MESPRKPRFRVIGVSPVKLWVRNHPVLAVFLVLAILQLAEGTVWFVSDQHRIRENRNAIAKINRLGEETKKATALRRSLVQRTDLQLCRQLKQSNETIRSVVLAGPEGQAAFLHIIGIDDPNVVNRFIAQSRLGAQRTAARFPDPDCTKLPSGHLAP